MKIQTAAVLFFSFATYACMGQTIAYDIPAQVGNQGYTGNLGLDFDVTQAIFITALGAFDSGGDGFVNSITVGIFNRETQTLVGVTHTFTGTNELLVNGERIFDLGANSFLLPVGHYSVVAVGFSNSDPDGNYNVPDTFNASTENTGGSIVFVGSGRYDANTSLDFPGIVPPGLPSNVFNAGTFEFETANCPDDYASWWFWYVEPPCSPQTPSD